MRITFHKSIEVKHNSYLEILSVSLTTSKRARWRQRCNRQVQGVAEITSTTSANLIGHGPEANLKSVALPLITGEDRASMPVSNGRDRLDKMQKQT